MISCGAALHHLEVALAAQGWRVRVRRLPDPDDRHAWPRSRSTGRFRVPPTPARERGPARRTDRRRFGSWPVPAELIGELIELADLRGARLQAITEPRPRLRLFRAITDAAEHQAADPGPPPSWPRGAAATAGSPDGVPAITCRLPQHVPGAAPDAARSPAHSFPRRRTTASRRPPPAAALDHLRQADHWLVAGEVASAALLAATRDGLASSLLSQPLEVDDTRAFLHEHVVGSRPWHPQLLLRLGWLPAGTPQLPPTPRRPLEELLVVGNQAG